MTNKKKVQDKKDINGNENLTKRLGANYIGVGIALGTTMGLLFDNLALGISIGVAIGAGLSTSKKNKK